jgi:hypothetical protein
MVAIECRNRCGYTRLTMPAAYFGDFDRPFRSKVNASFGAK